MSGEAGGGALRSVGRRLLRLLIALLVIFLVLVLVDRCTSDAGLSGFLYDGF